MRNAIVVLVSTLFLAASFGMAEAGSARDYISIVGSSTVYPFATVVAEQFGKSTSFKTPKIESTGSGGGLKLFCTGVGVEHPDITNASRRIKQSEYERCVSNGVKEIVEGKIGYDGIVMANSKKTAPLKLTRKDLPLGLINVSSPDLRQIYRDRDRFKGVKPIDDQTMGVVLAALEQEASGLGFGLVARRAREALDQRGP